VLCGRDEVANEHMARIMSTDNLYQILGVPRDADDAAIKKAYRKVALSLHPDKCQLHGAKEAFQKVSSAFRCLSDADERAFYDRTGRTKDAGAGTDSQVSFLVALYRKYTGALTFQHGPQDLFRKVVYLMTLYRKYTNILGH
jgi:DnaJ family protein B protein 12